MITLPSAGIKENSGMNAGCGQFHQRFMRTFFVRNFGAKNYKVFWV